MPSAGSRGKQLAALALERLYFRLAQWQLLLAADSRLVAAVAGCSLRSTYGTRVHIRTS